MKKFVFVFAVVVISLSLSACTKKSDTTSKVNSSNIASEALPAAAGSLAATATSSSVSNASNQNSSQPKSYQQIDSFVEEKTQIDDTYKTNYQLALEDAQRALKGGAKYCGTIITFYGAQLTSQNIQGFLFYNDDFSKDYYWLVELNSYGSVKKTRSFIARRDIASDLKCQTNQTGSLNLFSAAYEQFTQTEKFKLIDPGIIAQTKLYPMDTGWSINVIDNAGNTAANEILNTQPSVSGSVAANAQATATSTAQALLSETPTRQEDMF